MFALKLSTIIEKLVYEFLHSKLQNLYLFESLKIRKNLYNIWERILVVKIAKFIKILF